MSFLAPWMLLGTSALAIPIVLHFFFRSRYRTVPWAAMKFLLASIEQTSRRLRFQELLLLVLRCTLLAVLAIAMARPVTSAIRGTGRGDAVDAVFVVDLSYSMGAADGALTRLERAKQAALDTIDKLPPHSTVQVVACSDRAELRGPRSPSNLDQARQVIQALELTSLASDLAPGLAEAKSVLERGQLPNKELHVFSDFQKSGWDQQASTLLSHLREIKDKAGITLIRCGNRPVKNAAIVGLTPQAGIPRPGERIGFAILVRNSGNDDLTDVRLALFADGDEKNAETQTLPTLPAGETRAVTLSARFEKAGPRVLSARILHDDLEGDNRYDQVVPVREQVSVLVVNGGPNDRDVSRSSTYFLNHALLPIKDLDRPRYYLQVREVEPRLASPALLAKTDLVVLVNAGVPSETKKASDFARRMVLPTDFVSELGTWVRQGHGLVIVPGENVVPEAYNETLGKKVGLLPLPIRSVAELDLKKAPSLSRASFALPDFWKFKEDRYFAGFDDIKAWKLLELDDGKKDASIDAGATVVLRYRNDWPAIARRKVDAGEVFLLTTAAEPSWGDLPLHLEFIPLMQTLVAHLLHGQTQNHNAVAGETLTWYPRDKDLHNYTLHTPDGRPVRLGLPDVKEKRQVLSIPDLTRAGVYRLMARSATQERAVADAGIPLAVTPDLRESVDLQSLSDEQIDARLGFEPVHVIAGSEAGSAVGMDHFRREWTLWMLLAVLLLTVGESALAWLCGRAW